MAKLAKKFKAPVVAKQVFASRSEVYQKLMAGKSVYQIAEELDLDETDLDIIVGQNEVFSLLIIHNGVEVIIPMSSKLIALFEEEGLDPEEIMELEFRVTDAPVYKTVDGKKVKTDELAPFLNVGLKGGTFTYERKNAMADVAAE